MKYFNNITTFEELKRKYREYCLAMHPDRGGNAAEFQAMGAEFEQVAKGMSGNPKSTEEPTGEDMGAAFADMMGAPLRGTKGKTFADLVAHLVEVFTTPEMLKDYNTAGDLSECYGWDGSGLSPMSRTAFCNKFGALVVDLAEMAARLQMKKDENEYNKSNHAAHMREAKKHQEEGNKAPKAGAFVFATGCGWKSDGGRGVFVNFEAFAHDADNIHKDPNLCKVCEVYEVSAEDFARPSLADELVEKVTKEGKEFAGGAATDDPDRHDPRDKYRYFYTCAAAVVCRSSGRWFLIDAEGYRYARYCMMPTNWREIFADEVAQAQAKEETRREEERKEEERKAAERRAEYVAKMKKYEGAGLEDLQPYKDALKEANDKENAAYKAANYRRTEETKQAGKESRRCAASLMAAEKRNILAMASHIYPGIRAKVVKSEAWKGCGFTLVYQDGPTRKDFVNNTDFDLFRTYWEEYRMDDYTDYHREEFTEFADKYGDGHGVTVEREMSEETKKTLKDAILSAVPAAAGICWENRHEWTTDELKAAAAACGVDGFDLCNEYDRKKSYYNFIDADNLAEWCFNCMAFDVEAPKAKKNQKAPKDEHKESEPTATPAQAEEVPTMTEAPAEGLQLVEIAGGVAVVGDDWKATYYNKKAIKAHGCKWNKEAKRWEATDPADVVRVRAWFALRDGFGVDEEQGARANNGTAEEVTATPSEPTAKDEQPATDIAPVLSALADLLASFADIIQEAKKWEGVTIPADTLNRWRKQTEQGATNTAAKFAEVCACLGSMTPDNRKNFDALGVIFWTLSEQIRNGYDADAIKPATEYARAQLFDLIDRTQTENQARAIREALGNAA